MSFREMSAWITLTSVLACFGVYFGSLATGWVHTPSYATLHLLLMCVGALVMLVTHRKSTVEPTPAEESS